MWFREQSTPSSSPIPTPQKNLGNSSTYSTEVTNLFESVKATTWLINNFSQDKTKRDLYTKKLQDLKQQLIAQGYSMDHYKEYFANKPHTIQ